MSKLETDILEAKLSNSAARSMSPARSISSGSDDASSSTSSNPAQDSPKTQTEMEYSDNHSAQTGPKGVISDKRSQDKSARQQRNTALRDIINHQESKKMVALTLDEEDTLKKAEEEKLIRRSRLAEDEKKDLDDEEEKFKEEWRAKRREQIEAERNGLNGMRSKRGLREIGKEGFVEAVEKPGWVVVLIYEPGIPRCSTILASTLQLSLSEPPIPIQLYRARATSLSFSLLPNSESGDDSVDPKADPDVLPTLLAYKNGELEKTWIRVDWDIREDGVEGLLRREGILP